MTKPLVARFAASCWILAALWLSAGATAAKADTLDYVVTSTYDGSTSLGPLSAPSTSFTFTFSEPDMLSSLDTFVPATYTLGGGMCCTFSGTAEVQFFPDSVFGLFSIVLNTPDGDNYLWAFFGPQIFSGSNAPFSLPTGTFDINDVGSPVISTFDDNAGFGLYSGTFTGGTVTVTSESATVPEPASVFLLGMGLLGVGSLRRRSARARISA